MPTNTSGGTTTSLFNTPQATDNCYTADEDCVYYFDVMSDDLGGNAKVLWSIDDNNLYGTTTTSADGTTTTTTDVDSTLDLTVRDAVGAVEKSALGASISIENGKVKYDARALDWLADGQTATDYFTYAIRLGNGTLSWATVKIMLTGSNDLPTIVSATATGDVTEKAEPAEGGTLSDTGTITFADVDLTDTHSATVSATVVDENGTTLASPLGALTLGTVDQTANSVGWTFSVDDSSLDFLGEGETRIQVYTIIINDGHVGGNVSQTVTITITGTNDAPVLTVDQLGGVTEDAASPTLSDSGALSFTDVDVTDSHTVSASYNGDASWTGGSLTAGQIATLTAGFTVDNDSWDYALANAAVQFLGTGETITLSFDVTVTDDSGALNDSDTETVTLTITGTNDDPDIRVDVGDSASASLPETNGGLSTSGTLTVTDADTSDVVSTSIALTTVTGNQGSISNAALLAMLSVLPASGLAANSGAANNLTWNFNSGGQAFNYLTPTESLQLTYTLTVNDGQGGTDTQTVTTTIQGTNDAPVLTGDLVAPINEGGTYQLTTADLNFMDPDDVAAGVIFTVSGLTNGTLFVNGIAGTSFTGTQLAAGLVTFTHDDSETLTAGFSVSVEDGNEDSSAPIAQPLMFTVTAVNDAPVNAMPAAFSTNEDTPLTLTGLSVTDADAAAGSISVTLTVATGTLAASTGGSVTVSGSGTGSIVLTGTVAAINAFLASGGTQPVFTPVAGAGGVVTLTMTTNDNGNTGVGGALSDTDTRTITVNAVNDNPITTTDIIWASNATAVTLPWDVLLGNDSDPDGLALALQSVVVTTGTLGGAGTVTVNANGTFSFTTGAAGGTVASPTTVTLTYTTIDGLGGSATGTVTLRVVAVDTGGNNQDTINLTVASAGAYQAAYIDGKANQDTLTDGGAYSVLIGGAGNDTMNGSAGNDILRGGAGNDGLDGGAGEDMLDLSDSTAALGTLASPFIFSQSGSTSNAQTGQGNDTHTNMEGVIGTGNADFITGSATNDIIRGGAGNDTLNGGAGTADLLDLSDATAGFTINFTQGAGSITATGTGTDSYNLFEGVIGSGFADTINGSAGNDFVRGRGGNDIINGGDGNDTITGGLGADTLTGGNGSDNFVFDGLNGVDTITDFDATADLIHLEDFIFTAIGATLDVGEFVSNSGGIAGDADDFLLYDSDTGSLYYDGDGNGSGARILIATLTGAPTVGPGDILII